MAGFGLPNNLFAKPKGGVLNQNPSTGWRGALTSGIQDNRNMIMAIGGGLLNHSKNAALPVMDTEALTAAGNADYQRRMGEQELARRERTESLTAGYIRAKKPNWTEEQIQAATMNEAILADVLKDDDNSAKDLIKIGKDDRGFLNPNTGQIEYFDRAEAGMEAPLDPEDEFDMERELANDYSSHPDVKAYNQIRRGYESVRAAATEGSGAGDIGLMVGYMKMIDPGSTVNGGEMANVQNAGGVEESIRQKYNQLIGGGKLSKGQRQEVFAAAEAMYREQEKTVEELNQQFSNRATNWRLKPDRIIRKTPKFEPMDFGDAIVEEILD